MKYLVLLSAVLIAEANLLYPFDPSGLPSPFNPPDPSGAGVGLPSTTGIGYPNLGPSSTGSGLPSPGTGFPSSLGTGYPSSLGTGYPSSLGTGSPGSGFPSSLGTGYPSSLGTGYPSSLGTGYPSSLGTGYPSSLGTGFPSSPLGSFYGPSCDEDCKDMNTLFCMLQVTKCNSPKLGVNLAAKRACPKTCGSCTPCTYEQKKCESEKTCFDKSPQWCQFALKGKCSEASSHGLVVRKHCRVTCEECRPCKAPPVYQAPPCSNDCEDLRDDCPRLATEMRYCTYPDYTDWMQSNCKLSCGLCKKCRAPPKLPSLISAPPAPPQGYKPTPTPTDEPISTYSPEDVYAILSELYGNDTDNGTSITKKKFGPENTLQYEVKRECKQYKIQMQASLQEQCLAAHNYYRCLHNVPELEYDDILATSAYSYAIKMANDGMYGAASVKPSLVGIDREQDVGENIAWQMNRYNQFNIYQAVSGWYAEGLNYDHENPGYNDKTSHFTQLVWKGSSKVGCGLKKRGNEIYIVAHYQAAGNVPMKFPANVKPPKNACKAQCSSGRCQGNNAEKSTCNCGQGRQYDAPVCTGGCVAFCPKPYGYRGMWKERCAGSVSCTCLKPGYGYGRRFGATCR